MEEYYGRRTTKRKSRSTRGRVYFDIRRRVATDFSLYVYYVINKLCSSAQAVMVILEETNDTTCEKDRVRFIFLQIKVTGF